jgi:hemerythrin-like domain-containing protein
MNTERRKLITHIGAVGAGFMLASCTGGSGRQIEKVASSPKSSGEKAMEVSAIEDLMREHGILRRALLIYTHAANRLQSNPSSLQADWVQQTAKLFRAFGEDYHERRLEETYIFPLVKRAGGKASAYPDILISQHQRGREITEYILVAMKEPKLVAANAGALAQALNAFVYMYRNHAAREDTVVFPAWKQDLTAEELDEMGEKFEEIEHQQFGEDGFEKAVKQISDIEAGLGLADLSQFTAPPPPKQ